MLILLELVGRIGVLWGEMGQMLLTGAYERLMDEKLRVALPKPLREILAEDKQLVLTPGTDGSLSLFPSKTFAALAEKLAEQSPTGKEIRAFSRLLYAQSHTIEIDSQGRVRLTAELAQLAGLDGAVVLVGVGDRVELWNKSRWEAYLSQLQPRYDELAENAFSQKPASSLVSEVAAEPAARPLQPR